MGQNNPFRTIWGLAKSPELQMSSEELHILVAGLTRKDSLKSLSQKECDKVILRLLQMKDSVRKDKSYRKKKRGRTSTEYQRKKIYMLSQELGWNEARVNGMCKRMFQINAVEWLNYQQCSKLIEALKNMVERERSGQAAKEK